MHTSEVNFICEATHRHRHIRTQTHMQIQSDKSGHSNKIIKEACNIKGIQNTTDLRTNYHRRDSIAKLSPVLLHQSVADPGGT